MGFILLWFVFAIIVGAIGSSRKIGFFGGFVLSVILSPLIGLICVLVSKSLSAEAYEKQMLSKMDQMTGNKTLTSRDTELLQLSDRHSKGEISDYDYNLLKGEILRRYE